MLYYNAAYLDGSARAVKDFQKGSKLSGHIGELEFGTRCPPPAQWDMDYGRKYSYLDSSMSQLIPDKGILRDNILNTTNNIERGWYFFDKQQ